jgi:hypothetical protein
MKIKDAEQEKRNSGGFRSGTKYTNKKQPISSRIKVNFILDLELF